MLCRHDVMTALQSTLVISPLCAQASEAPLPGQDRIDPDLLGTTYTLALLNGNETAYNMVMEDYLEVQPLSYSMGRQNVLFPASLTSALSSSPSRLSRCLT